jgi:hypothetical protein
MMQIISGFNFAECVRQGGLGIEKFTILLLTQCFAEATMFCGFDYKQYEGLK